MIANNNVKMKAKARLYSNKSFNNKTKIYLLTAISWIISVKLFFLLSFNKEYWTMWKYSNSIFDFYTQNISFLIEAISITHTSVLVLGTIFAILLIYFYYTYFFILFNKIDKNFLF